MRFLEKVKFFNVKDTYFLSFGAVLSLSLSLSIEEDKTLTAKWCQRV
jgi:hypothetical protein